MSVNYYASGPFPRSRPDGGLANLAAAEWFVPFRPSQARDPGRGLRRS